MYIQSDNKVETVVRAKKEVVSSAGVFGLPHMLLYN